jgi:hypothetical protein
VTSEAAPLHEVHLLRLPVAIHAQAQEHGAELLREMYLLSLQLGQEEAHHVPVRLTELVDALGNQFGGLTTAQDLRLEAAIADSLDEIDVTYQLPVEVGAASSALGAMLDEADEFCLQGQHLLTLSTPEPSVRYRRWYLGEFVDQLAGKAPTSWPDYVGRS